MLWHHILKYKRANSKFMHVIVSKILYGKGANIGYSIMGDKHYEIITLKTLIKKHK